MFLLLQGVSLVLMLNLLIALMGSSYEKVLETSAETLSRERCKWILTNLRTISMVPGWATKVQEDTAWFHVIVPETVQAEEDEPEWSGILASVKRSIGHIRQEQVNFRD